MNDNLGIGVMSSVNFKERYTACKLTWLKDFDNTYIFGGHDANLLDENLISIENAGEDWPSCFLKQQIGLKYIFESNPNYDWYCIVGCDNVLFKSKIIEELSKYNPNDELFLSQPCGLWSDYPYLHEVSDFQSDGITFRAIAGGAGFFISNTLMKKCYHIIDDDIWIRISGSHYGCADVGISYMMKKYFNIDPIHVLYMLSQSPNHYNDVNNNRWYRGYSIDVLELLKTPMSLHYIKPSEMFYIYDEYKK